MEFKARRKTVTRGNNPRAIQHTGRPKKGPGATLERKEEMVCGWGYQGGLHTRWHLNYTKKDRNSIPDLDE